jgi:hypothetical protein
MGTKGEAATCFPLRRFICVRMAWHVFVLCGLHARIAQYGDKRTHTLQWPRAHTLLGNNADDMVLALTNFVFCCSSELVLV